MRRHCLAAAVVAAALLVAGTALAATPGVSECMDCHGDKTIEKSLPDGKTVSLYVDLQAYRQSVHGGSSCVTCHADAKAPHDKLGKVSCGKCHGDAEKSYAASA
ncbi:MAG TPA: cytochrome c3 family protein, partial [Candidatus Deferrimicrobiaceae bacterium]